ncbi:MAG: ASCH domain protein [Parcubacteria group bacterium GW2011_GWA2_47_21]|nr:MAG: ASCH domain protein [Parcubacteria group bacterium GW2011_GWA2_47_21]
MIIKKKIWPEYFEAVSSGKKKFELRLNDFDVSEADTLVLEEWDPQTKEYTGRVVEKKVSYVGKWKIEDLAEFWPIKEIKEKGLQIISWE